MNVLFLGNGFDLAHNLPTKYINFLNTVHSLSDQDISQITSVGEVFSNPKLLAKDKDIRLSYEQYKNYYDATRIEISILNKLQEFSKNNVWYRYLSNSFAKDVSWVDFEKEIGKVIRSFEEMLEHCPSDSVIFYNLSKDSKFIISVFDFFLKHKDEQVQLLDLRMIKEEYLIEYSIGSLNFHIDIDKIVKYLFNQLNELSNCLSVYLMCFVESMVRIIPDEHVYPWKEAFTYTDQVFTFNYTNTYEIIYNSENVCHLHGNVNDKIILGLNPDCNDNIESVDTTFLCFKKYFQRIKYRTDLDYLHFIANNQRNNNITLYVIGHSLNVTDQDIIKELFSIATNIFIANYDDNDEESHIVNIVNIFGKKEFDELRRIKNLRFISNSDPIASLMRFYRNQEEVDYVMSRIKK